MTFVPFPNTVLLTHRFSWNGAAVSMGLHLSRPGYTPANAQLLADDSGSAWAAELAAVQTDNLLSGVVVVQDLSAEGAPNYENPDEVGVSGDLLEDSAPNNTALIISHRTNDTGRSARGRTYFLGLGEGSVIDGLPTALAITNISVAWAAYIVALEFQGWTFVVAQRIADGVPLVVGVTREVTTELFPVRLGTQRRRQAS